MSANLINLRTIQFSDKFALLSQQYGSRLQGLVGQGQYQGKQASPVNQVAPTAAVPVTERFTPESASHLTYQATIEDPKVFTRPWKMSFPIYRRVEPNVQLVEFNCVPFVEEMMYAPVGLYKPRPK